jgi:peptidyl-dipeptidase Dcp
MRNPLLHPPPLKSQAIAFDQLKVEHFPDAMESALAHGRARLLHVKERSASFENTIVGLEHTTEDVEFVFTLLSNLTLAHGNNDLRHLRAKLGAEVAAFANDILLDADVFGKVDEVFQKRTTLGLPLESVRLIEKFHQDFLTNGAALSQDKKQRLRAIDERLATLGPRYHDNVLTSTNAFQMWLST